MAITYDPANRDGTFAERGLDFEDAALVFSGETMDFRDLRKDQEHPHQQGLRFLGCLGLIVWFHSGWQSSPVMSRVAISAFETLMRRS